MKRNLNLSSKYSTLLEEPEIRLDDEETMFIDFDDIKIDFNKDAFQYKDMLDELNVEVKVFNELYLDKATEFVNVFNLDISYPLFV
jgi:hypothetical protein